MPRPMAAGVFGIERITAEPFGKCRSKPAMVRPAAMDSTTVSLPASFASGGNTSSITCGLTATTITAGGSRSPPMAACAAMPCRSSSSLARGGGAGSCTRMRAGVEPALEPAGEQGRPHVAGAGEQ